MQKYTNKTNKNRKLEAIVNKQNKVYSTKTLFTCFCVAHLLPGLGPTLFLLPFLKYNVFCSLGNLHPAPSSHSFPNPAISTLHPCSAP